MSPRPLRVVHLITELDTGGAEQMLHKVTARMNRKGFRSIVVSMTDRGTLGAKISAEGIPVFHLGMTLGRPRPSGFLKLYRLIRKARPHILQTWLYHADLLGILAGRMARVPKVIWGIRCSEMDLKNYRFLTTLTVRLNALLSPLADAIIVNSEEGKRVHERLGYHPGRMCVIPNGFDTHRFHPDPGARDWLLGVLGLGRECVLIGLVARLDPMKDHGTFFRAASIQASREANVHFVLVGKGMVRGNTELTGCLDPNLKGRVHLMGPREDIPRLTSALDIATNSSAYGEGFSNTIGEAMACGVPCVVTAVGDARRIVGDTGIVVAPRDPEAMADAWLRLLEMGRDNRRKLGERARKRTLGNYDIEKIVRQFEDLYEAVMADSIHATH
ncbi:MAG: glycosyltransferase [Thermodesulfobacteriota bacterium]